MSASSTKLATLDASAAPNGAGAMVNDDDKVNVALTGVTETMLITLFARAQDAAKENPVLGDQWAAKLLERMDYTTKRTLLDSYVHLSCVLRARMLDAWTLEFLRDQAPKGATVLHLACGLDTRSLRLGWQAKNVRWIDIDVADVVALRRKLLPSPSGDYSLLTINVNDDAWLDQIPADRPTIVVMEGLIMYLEEAEVRRLMARLCDRFPRGQIVFDGLGWLTVRLQMLIRPVKKTGAVMRYGLDDGRDLESVHSKLRLKTQISNRSMPGADLFPWIARLLMWLYSWFPYLRTFGSMMRYEFA